jgi:hypothetical protein
MTLANFWGIMASFRTRRMPDWDQFRFSKGEKMKHYKYLSMLVIALVALLFSASPVVAGAQMTTFTGTSSFGESINPGEWMYLPSGNIQARGIVEVYHDVNADARVTGNETTTYNASFKPAPSSPIGLSGRIWGTVHIANEGGSWDGSWTAEITENGEYFARGVAHGNGGYEGLIGHWNVYSSTPTGPFELSGWILEP